MGRSILLFQNIEKLFSSAFIKDLTKRAKKIVGMIHPYYLQNEWYEIIFRMISKMNGMKSFLE